MFIIVPHPVEARRLILASIARQWELERAVEQKQKLHTHMVLVLDEHGGGGGLVALEDLLE